MAAISSPNLVRATMHMRGELGTNQKPLLVQTKSQGMSTIDFPALNYPMDHRLWYLILRYESITFCKDTVFSQVFDI